MPGFGNDKSQYAGGMETAVEDSQFVDKILEVSNNVKEAIRRTKITDDRMLNDVTKLFDWLTEFKVLNGLETLKLWLDGRLSIGGFNFVLAIQGDAKIPVPSAMGVHLSKEDTKAVQEIAKSREKFRAKQNEEDSD
jgi:hypothetical protein